jgi:hypothetical protein
VRESYGLVLPYGQKNYVEAKETCEAEGRNFPFDEIKKAKDEDIAAMIKCVPFISECRRACST